MNDEINTAQPLILQPQCVDCRFYDGFGACTEHGYQLRDNCEDFVGMETINKYVEDMENHKKKYEEALERARKELQELKNKDCDDMTRRTAITIIHNLFPELAESEDERIRKGLINGFKECLEDCQYPKNAVKYWHNVKVDNILAWLEKQGEQKAGKIEPNPAWGEEDEGMLTWLCRIIHSQRLSKEITLKEESELGKWMDKWLNHNTQTKQGEQKQTWEPSADQLIVIKDLIEDKNTSKVNKTILRGMFDDVEQLINSRKREIDDAYLQGICDAKHEFEKDKKLNADEVIEWIDEHVPTKFEDMQNYVNQFKKDFGL